MNTISLFRARAVTAAQSVCSVRRLAVKTGQGVIDATGESELT